MAPRRKHQRSGPGQTDRRILDKPPKTARQVVYRALEHHEETGEFFSDHLQSLASKAELSSADRRLAREIVAGVIRRRQTLDTLIAAHVKRPKDNVEEPLWRLLRMGVYELAFLDHVPAHASVNETTELARFLRRPRWTGFLNGTLRSVARGLTDEHSDSPAADAFPLSSGRYRKCAGPWFPDPTVQPLEYFAAAFSFPIWLAKRWQSREVLSPLPSRERPRVRGNNERHAPIPPSLEALGFWFNSPPPMMLRVNPLKTSRDEVLETFKRENIDARTAELPGSIVLAESQNVSELPGFADGHFTVQDLTAMQVIELLSPEPGEIIWDVCAAPGTKTTGLAERMQNQGRILASDINADRLALIEQNTSRLGLGIVEVQTIGANGESLPAGPFDAALVDAPCSNTGVLGKRVEARWRLGPRDLVELPLIQSRLLEAAAERIKAGGRIVYSTCSIEPEENQAVVQAFLNDRPEWNLITEETHWPGQPADGGYAALLKRQ